jgi:hypothetical protein
MQTFKIEVNDNIADKILWLLSSFKNDVKIEKISKSDKSVDTLSLSVKQALEEVEASKKNGVKLDSAWKLLDEL